MQHGHQVVYDELMMDGNSRQNLETFCQTWIEDEVHELMNECIDEKMRGRAGRSGTELDFSAAFSGTFSRLSLCTCHWSSGRAGMPGSRLLASAFEAPRFR